MRARHGQVEDEESARDHWNHDPCWPNRYMDEMLASGKKYSKSSFRTSWACQSTCYWLYTCCFPDIYQHGTGFIFSREVEILRVDGYLTLILLTHGNPAAFLRLMKYVDPMAMNEAHPSLETYSYKCAPGLKTLLVE